MVKYALKRIVLAFFTAFIILSLTFLCIKLLPFPKPAPTGDEAVFAYYQRQIDLGYVFVTTKPIEGVEALWDYVAPGSLIRQYFYQEPIFAQYGRWLGNIFTKWDWGVSNEIEPNVGVIYIILGRLPTTIKINIWSVIISVPTGIALGVWAALKKNTMTDHVISTLIMIFISIPSFITITLLLLIFSYNTGWLPTQWPSATAPLATRIAGYVIPVASLSFGSICGYCRFTRAELCEVMASDYLLLARTKGLTRSQTITRHALRNAMVPIVPSILSEFIGILGGSMILEKLYGIQGIGDLFIQAINKNDFNVLFVDMALFTTISLLAGVILDISYGFIDPRIRMGAKK